MVKLFFDDNTDLMEFDKAHYYVVAINKVV
jgi:hypothetical protein